MTADTTNSIEASVRGRWQKRDSNQVTDRRESEQDRYRSKGDNACGQCVKLQRWVGILPLFFVGRVRCSPCCVGILASWVVGFFVAAGVPRLEPPCTDAACKAESHRPSQTNFCAYLHQPGFENTSRGDDLAKPAYDIVCGLGCCGAGICSEGSYAVDTGAERRVFEAC